MHKEARVYVGNGQAPADRSDALMQREQKRYQAIGSGRGRDSVVLACGVVDTMGKGMDRQLC